MAKIDGKYEQALERCRKLYNEAKANGYASDIDDYETIFPELKESDDERIRKAIINVFATHKDYEMFFGVSVEDILAWLEKQGEHANFLNNIQIGDKVTRNRDGVLVNLSQLNRVAKKDEKQGEQRPIKASYTTIVETGNGGVNACVTRELSNGEQKPADKVEPKFKVGDTVKDPYGDLYHITEIIDDSYKTDDGRFILFENQEVYTLSNFTAWSEDDEDMFKRFVDLIPQYMTAHGYNELFNWLKSLKDRVQPKQEWSEEDENLRRRCIGAIDMANLSDYTKDSLLNWLKSLRPQNRWKPSDEQMEALWNVYRGGKEQAELATLYNDLKKLRNE